MAKRATHGNAHAHGKEKTAHYKVRAHGTACDARQRVRRTAKAVPCNNGQTHGKDSFAIDGIGRATYSVLHGKVLLSLSASLNLLIFVIQYQLLCSTGNFNSIFFFVRYVV
jgi:hypothetical protein